jgi:hypothetical protein
MTFVYLFSANPLFATQRSFAILDSGNLHALYIFIITPSILPIRSVPDHTIQAFVQLLVTI